LLETAIVPYQSFADKVNRLITIVVKAEVVVQVDATFDNLTAAIAFDVEGVVSFFVFGSSAPTKEIFEEAHDRLSFLETSMVK
jgi:hypothetical protein